MKSLSACTNIFNETISDDCQRRIKTYLRDPTSDNWDDIAGIIIKSNMTTVWQAVITFDPTFPRHGRSTDKDGNVIAEWGRIPTPLQVLQAIKVATE